MNRVFAMGLVLLSAAPVAPAGYWFENFDARPTGTVTNNPGWSTIYDPESTAPGSVSASNPLSPPNALYLAPVLGVGVTKRAAVYSGTSHNYTGANEFLVRLGAWIYRDNRSQYLSLHLGSNSASKLSIGTSLAGTVVAGGIDTGAAFVTGRYAQAVLWYDMQTDKAMMQYDGVTVLGWTNIGAGFTGFNRVWAQRTKMGAVPDTGALYIDDLSVETIPLSTWGWWRFEEGAGANAGDHAGRFRARPLDSPPAQPWRPTPWDHLVAGGVTVRSDRAAAGPRVYLARAELPLPATTNWTVEFLFLNSPGFTNAATLFYWFDQGEGASSSILIQRTSNHWLAATLRDHDSSEFAEVLLLTLPEKPNNEWHHLAIAKSKNAIQCLYDYELAVSVPVGTNASGAYEFSTASVAFLGGGILGQGTVPDDMLVDEVRISNRLLNADEYLHLGGIRLVGVELRESGGGRAPYIHAACRPDRIYKTQYSVDNGKNWLDGDTWWPNDLIEAARVLPVLNTNRMWFRAVETP